MKTLIVYATKYGSAAKCAQLIKQKCNGEVEVVDLRLMKDVAIGVFDTIIIGGSIYAGRIQKEVSEFCSQYLEELKQKKLGLYINCMNEEAAQTQLHTVFPKELIDIAVAKASLGGEYNFSKMNFIEKMIIALIHRAHMKENPDIKPINTKENLSELSIEKIDLFCKMIS